MNVKQYIRGNAFLHKLFRNFTEEDLSKIDIVYYAPDIPILNENLSSDYLYLIVKGICGMFNNLDNGESFCYYKISSDDVIGVAEVIDDEYKTNAYVQTLTKVEAFKIRKAYIDEWRIKYPEFYNGIMFNVIDRLHATLRTHVECKRYSSHTNIVSYFIYSYELYRKIYADDYKGDVKINETRTMMSDFIGISLRSMNGSIEILKNMNLIHVKLGKIHINHEQYNKLVEYKKELLL